MTRIAVEFPSLVAPLDPSPLATKANVGKCWQAPIPYQRKGCDFSSPGGIWIVSPIARLMLTAVNARPDREVWELEIVAQGLLVLRTQSLRVSCSLMYFPWVSMPLVLVDIKVREPVSHQAR